MFGHLLSKDFVISFFMRHFCSSFVERLIWELVWPEGNEAFLLLFFILNGHYNDAEHGIRWICSQYVSGMTDKI